MKNSRLLFSFLFLLLLSACQSNGTQGQSGVVTFFDLKAYFTQEIDQLAQLQGSITKTTQINGEKEVHTFDSLNFAQDLKIFIDSDINRPAWSDQYRIDSTLAADGSLKVLEYHALEPDLKTRKLRVEFSGQKVQLIQIHNLTKNALMNAALNLEYHPGRSYRIQSNQKLKLSEEREMIVEVRLP